MTSYILLCRHGRHRKGSLIQEQLEDGTTEYPGAVIGDRLKEQFAERPGTPPKSVTHVHCARSDEAVDTLKHIAAGLGFKVSQDRNRLTRDALPADIEIAATPSAECDAEAVDDLAKTLGLQATEGNNSAILVVGHQPLLSRLADSLLRSTWMRRVPPVPLGHSDVACIAVQSKKRWLEFVISYDDKANADLVRKKIERKMESAKLLGGLLTVGITVLCGVLFDETKFNDLSERQWAVQLGTVFFLVAAVLYLATMYAYDTLLMPQRFWGESRPKSRSEGRASQGARAHRWLVERPPSSSAWILYQNMMRIWRTRFTLASAFLVSGTALLAYAALRVHWCIAIGAGALLTGLIIVWIRATKPRLGSED